MKKLSRLIRERYETIVYRDSCKRLGVALTAAGIVGLFIAPEGRLWAAIPLGIGLALCDYVAKKPKGGIK